MAAACSGLNPFGLDIRYEDFDLEGQIWAVSGFKGPYGQQEIGRMHYKDADENLIAAEFTFKDGKATVVFPSGAYLSHTAVRSISTATRMWERTSNWESLR